MENGTGKDTEKEQPEAGKGTVVILAKVTGISDAVENDENPCDISDNNAATTNSGAHSGEKTSTMEISIYATDDVVHSLDSTPRSPAEDNQYFFEDQVFRVDNKGKVKFGLVIETCETYSADEDDEYDEALTKGEVRVAWFPEGTEEVHQEAKITLADRTLMPGDVVRRLMPGKDTQRGYCREINMHADVRVLGTKYVIKNVMTERLRPINTWQRDSAVCLDSWVGSTRDVEEKAVLRSTSGARIQISSNMFYAFSDSNSFNSRGIYNPHIFYAGNVVIGRLPSLENVKLLTPNIPIYKNKKGKPFKSRYTIESVETEAVWVHWQCKALSEETDIAASLLERPNPCVTGDDLKRLKRLNLFESCMLQISDRSYLKFSLLDSVTQKSYWEKEQGLKFKSSQKYPQVPNICFQLSNTTNSSNNSAQNIEKAKKRGNQIDNDKSTKTKKFVGKTDKINSSNSKEKGSASEASVDTKSSVKSSSRTDNEWITDDEEVDDHKFSDEDFNEENVSSTTSCSTPSPHVSPKHVNRPLYKKKNISSKRKENEYITELIPKDGDELVTETLLVYSTATVVWQDGSIENGIPSTQLYPIHHLDNHEFFPGDFVVSLKEESEVSFRDYGVIQTVDHHGRTARVKWFTTYTSADEAKPTYKGESEVSVYDLKDHPDFQYRPGTMVIRVANFVGEDATCTAGQIIDNYTDGRAKVWWVDGHISMCWPQDLFEVAQYGHTDWGHESDDSWETESENSELGGGTPRISTEEINIAYNVDRARVAMARLEEIFNMSPNLQNNDVMRKLLTVYKGCRYLDRLLNTNLFHEDNFNGLIERVKKAGTQSMDERSQDRKNRLFSVVQTSSPTSKQLLPANQQETCPQQQQQQSSHYQAIVAGNSSQKLLQSPSGNSYLTNSSKEYAPKILFNVSSTPFKYSTSSTASSAVSNSSGLGAHPSSIKRKSSNAVPVIDPTIAAATEGTNEDKSAETPTSLYNLLTNQTSTSTDVRTINSSPAKGNVEENANIPLEIQPSLLDIHAPSSNIIVAHCKQNNSSGSRVTLSQQNAFIVEKNHLLNSALANIEKAYEKTSQLKTITPVSQDDSGNFSKCDGSSPTYAGSCDLTNNDANNSLVKVNDEQKSISFSSVELNEEVPPEFVCARLCSLMKDQLVKCTSLIRERFHKKEDINTTEEFEWDMEAGELPAVVPEMNVTNESAANTSLNISKTSESSESQVESQVLPSTFSVPLECFQMLSNAPTSHKYHLAIFHPNNPSQYNRAVQREHRMLKNSLPPGVWVRAFEDRLDLLSVMMEGPKKTPYEDGLFFFDIQLGSEYPKSAPLCHYISFCTDRLNPNLYEDGKVCVSLLGTWAGRESELWGPNSTLLQVIVSIQGLILVPEPYFNEAGYEKQKGSQQGSENSRMYNEMVMIKMVQATTKLLQQPPELFRQEIMEHFQHCGLAMYVRIKGWMELSKTIEEDKEKNEAVESNTGVIAGTQETYVPPDFPLVPASRGFCLTLAGLLNTFKAKLEALKLTSLKPEEGNVFATKAE